MTWRIFHPFDGLDLPDAKQSIWWSKEELHNAQFIADVGMDDDQFIAFFTQDERVVTLLSYDLYQDGEDDDRLLKWEGLETSK